MMPLHSKESETDSSVKETKLMSTRATYRFIPKNSVRGRWQSITTIYIHHDGYPEGAASYLEDAFTAEAFLAKNDRAEVTESHEIHGDTEYRYDITEEFWVGGGASAGYGVRAFKRDGYMNKGQKDNPSYDAWVEFFHGAVDGERGFLDTYKNTPIAKAINSI